MYEEIEKIENIETITIYRMIESLLRYDYYSTKCLVNELIVRRTKTKELWNLKQIQDLIFYQKIEELKQFLIKVIEEEGV